MCSKCNMIHKIYWISTKFHLSFYKHASDVRLSYGKIHPLNSQVSKTNRRPQDLG